MDCAEGCSLPDEARVLAPDKEHILHRGCIVGEVGADNGLPPDYRVVEMASTGKAFGLPEGRLVPWDGYAARVLEQDGGSSSSCEGRGGGGGGGGGPTAPGDQPTPISIWRCEIWTEGLFSLLFWALGWLETEAAEARAAKAPRRFLIDWTDSRILFHGGRSAGCPNLWNAFFEQPPGLSGAEEPLPALAPGDAALVEAAEAADRLSVVVRFGPPWFRKLGEFRGADQGQSGFKEIRGGRLDADAADAGRAALRRWIRIHRRHADRAERVRNEIFRETRDADWLAVHIRRTDKLEQCRANQIPREELAAQIRAFCGALGSRGVFLCTDDQPMKTALVSDLRCSGLLVATHAALLSAGGQPSHKDQALDRRRNAEDVLVEVLIMARCGALLSTYSNVSVAAVYLAPPGFRYFMFGDAPPPAAAAAGGGLPGARREQSGGAAPTAAVPRYCAACGASGPPLCCSRCRSVYFCGQDCQRRAWRGHKPHCVPVAS